MALYVAGIIHLIGWLRRNFAASGPVFLMGHRVLPAGGGGMDAADRMALLSGHAITPQELQRRLKFVQRWVAPLSDPSELAAGIPKQRRAYLTFDDGYLDNLEVAAPVLKKLGVRAVLFVISDLLDKPNAQPWWDRWGAEALSATDQKSTTNAVVEYGMRCSAAKLTFAGLDGPELHAGPRRRYLSRAEMQSLPDQFLVANHTSGHAILNLLDDDAVAAQVMVGHRELSKHRNFLPVFAFPCGVHDQRVMHLIDGFGLYSVLFATGSGRNGDRLRQRRINLNVEPFSLFAAQSVGLL